MSENYELLRASQKELELFETRVPAGRGDNGHKGTYLNGNGRIREEVLKLIERVFLSEGPSAPHLVAFSAVEHGAGSSWVCAHVGEALATQVEGAVCLIDANPHSRSLHRYFGLQSVNSPMDAVAEHEPAQSQAQSIRGSNLWLVSGTPSVSPGTVARNPERLKMRLNDLCAQFRFVLLDAPPVNESADALMLGRMADGVILVLAAHSTRRAAAVRARQSLEAANVRLLGAVLNKRTYPIPDALYNRL